MAGWVAMVTIFVLLGASTLIMAIDQPMVAILFSAAALVCIFVAALFEHYS